MLLQNRNLKKFAFSAFAAFVSAASVVPFAQTAVGAPVNELARTSDGRWVYSFTSEDAARFGGNRPSELIQYICDTQSPVTVSNGDGAGGTITLDFSGDWGWCPGLVQVAEDWQSTSNGSWWLYGDISIYDELGNRVALLRI